MRAIPAGSRLLLTVRWGRLVAAYSPSPVWMSIWWSLLEMRSWRMSVVRLRPVSSSIRVYTRTAWPSREGWRVGGSLRSRIRI